MSEIKTGQFNTESEWKPLSLPEKSAYIEFPVAFTGNAKNDRTSQFAELNLSCQFVLAIIHTFNKIYREPAKLTYEFLVQNFGMSKETVSAAFKTLSERNIIEKIKRSRYKIIAKYRKNNYVEIDIYWFKHEWEINGKKKRLTYSRLLSLGFLKRSCANPKTDGIFNSSQARIGKALNLPRTTAGDSIREIKAAGLIRTENPGKNDAQRRGCSLFKVHPQLYKVEHPGLNLTNLKALSLIYSEPTAEQMHARLLGNVEYKNIIERIENNHIELIKKIIMNRGDNSPDILKLEHEKVLLRQELEEYLKQKRIKRSLFPPGFFKTDIINDN